jgi:putative solute:sodium symporter small subunit
LSQLARVNTGPVFVSAQRGKQMREENARAYWAANLKLIFTYLIIWFVVSYGCGILFVDALNNIQFFGFKLGFWFAQQGSIYVFLVLIWMYAFTMNKLDRKFDVHEE